MADWIDSFLVYTDGVPTPPLFRLWGGITAVGGALERRVWINSKHGLTFGNLYTVLTAMPGIGKTNIIRKVLELWAGTSALKVAPSSVTRASLVDALAEAKRRIVLSEKDMDEFHSLLAAASEFETLVPTKDENFASLLRELWDNPPHHKEQRRTTLAKSEGVLFINKPQLTILAGDTPARLLELLPDSAWGGGFSARLLFIFAKDTPYVDPFPEVEEGEIARLVEMEAQQKAALIASLNAIGTLYGQVKITPEGILELKDWNLSGMPPIPTHSKLTHYCSRRFQYTLKLSLIAGVSRTQQPLIDLADVRRAKFWLLGMEGELPNVFRSMSGKSDEQVLQELYHHLWWNFNNKDKEIGKPIPSAYIWKYLSEKVIVDKIPKLMQAAVQSNMISKIQGEELFIPNPKTKHGV